MMIAMCIVVSCISTLRIHSMSQIALVVSVLTSLKIMVMINGCNQS